MTVSFFPYCCVFCVLNDLPHYNVLVHTWCFHGSISSKEPPCQCRRHKRCRFYPWIRKIPWRRAWQSTLSILAWKIPWTEFSGELHTVHRVTKSPTWLKRLSTHSTYLMYALMIHSVYIIIYFMHEDKVWLLHNYIVYLMHEYKVWLLYNYVE